MSETTQSVTPTEHADNLATAPIVTAAPGAAQSEPVEAGLATTPLLLQLDQAILDHARRDDAGAQGSVQLHPQTTYRGLQTASAYPALTSDASPEQTALGELSSLVAGCGVFDLGYRTRLHMNGEDRQRWLNGMVTNTIKSLPFGEHNYSFILNAQGRIQGDGTVFALPGALVLETDRSQFAHLVQHLDHFIIMDDVELVPETGLTTLGLAGPGAAALLGSLGLPVPEQKHLVEASLGNQPVMVVCEGTRALPRFSLWIAETSAAETWNTLLAAGATAAGSIAIDALRVLEASPLYGVDIHDKTLAQETGQAQALNFTKGCYLGQEIVERIRSRATVHRGIRQFRLEGMAAAPGTTIFAEAAEGAERTPVGEVTSVAEVALATTTSGGASPLEGRFALGILRTEALERGAALSYAGGTAHALAVSPLTQP